MISNPYASLDLFLPEFLHSHRSELVVHAQASSQTGAFKRQIDLWWACVVAGVRSEQRVSSDQVGELVKFNTASILDSDAWRIVHIELIALAKQGFEVLESPSSVIRLVSEYAYGGSYLIKDELVSQPSPLAVYSSAQSVGMSDTL